MGSLYQTGISGYSGVSGFSGITGSTGPVIRSLSDFRLTLESGIPISSSNQEAKTTLYLTPYLGNRISLYYNSIWITFSSSEVSISLSGKTANKNNDVFAYYTGSAVALELVEWTNDSTRATSLGRQDGVYCKSGDGTRKYIGTIRTTGTTGQCEDSYTSRYVWNMFNRFKRGGFTTNTVSSWTYTTTAWREGNGGSGALRFKFVLGFPQVVNIVMCGNASGNGYVSCQIDNTNSYTLYYYIFSGEVYYGHLLNSYNYTQLTAGYHFVAKTEYGGTSFTNYAGGSTTQPNYSPTTFLDT